MTPRINIQFTIEMDELEDEVKRLIDKNVSYFEDMLQIFSTMQDTATLSHATAEKIDSARQRLSMIDVRLMDSHNLITGYLQYKSELRNSNKQVNNEVESESALSDVNGADMGMLKERLQAFKDNFDDFSDASHEVTD